MKNKIFLPITIFDHKKIINSFKELIEFKKTDFQILKYRIIQVALHQKSTLNL